MTQSNNTILKNSLQPYWFYGFLLIGIVIRLFIICLPVETILERWASDDLFYYSQIAGHFASGHGLTFDGINPTNGFQPLFFILLLPFGQLLLNDIETSLRIVLLLITLLSLVAALQLRKLLTTLGFPILGLFASILLFLHPKLLSVTFNGTEGALSLLTIILSLRAMYFALEQKRWLFVSLCFSALLLTRLDLSIFLFFIVVYLFWKRIPIPYLIKIGVLPGVVFFSWLTANYLFLGEIMPNSGAAKRLHYEQLKHLFPASTLHLIKKNLLAVYDTCVQAEAGKSWIVQLLLFIGTASFLFKPKLNYHRLWPVALLLGISGVSIAILVILTLGSYRDWYFMPLYLLICLIMAFAVFHVKKTAFAVGTISMILAGLWWEAQLNARQSMMGDYLNAAEKLEMTFPHTSTVGAFNAGIYNTSLGPEYTVVNLDGIVNHNAYLAIKAKRLREYLVENNINYLLDHTGTIQFFGHFSQFGLLEHLKLVRTFECKNSDLDISFYEVL